MKLIAFTGKIGAGKSTCAEFLEKCGYNRLAFAAPLKELISELFSIPLEHLNNQAKKEEIIKELNVTPRQLLQVIGTDCFRNCLHAKLPELQLQDNSIWIEIAKRKIEKYKRSNSNIVIEDARFENELQFIYSYGGIVINVIRPDVEKINNISAAAHESETSLNNNHTDITLVNNGNIEELYAKLQKII